MQTENRLSGKHKILTNDASHCFGVAACPCWWLGWLSDLVGLPCVSHAGCVGGDACVLLGFYLIQKAGTEWPNIHAQKYVIMEMLGCVWGEFCWFVSQNLYFACLCVRFQKPFGWIHGCFCLFSHCIDFLFQELFFLSINNNKEDGQGLQCRWSARMILSSLSIASESGEINSPLGTSVHHQDQLVDLPLLFMFKH